MSIPSPPVSSFHFGPIEIHFYALCILTGIVLAMLLTNRRLVARGVEKWLVIDIVILAVPLGIVGSRIFHVLTHPSYYFGPGSNPWNPFEPGSVWAIWEGGIAIYGGLIGGALGAWIGCRNAGLRLWVFADALAPGMLLAQACGRFGNWFNQELFGGPTTLPWGLEIDPDNPSFPDGLPPDTLFHPTFLYEVLWNGLGVLVLVWLGRFTWFHWGRLFASYLIWYGAGRVVWENIRIDPSEVIFGLRTNVWSAILGIAVGVVILLIRSRRTGVEPRPYVPGRGPEVDAEADAGATDADDPEVDESEPDDAELDESEAVESKETAETPDSR
ncbi:prolipoprotein diacylglyceryl transferase [Propionibacteriaceae bacterium Y2011]